MLYHDMSIYCNTLGAIIISIWQNTISSQLYSAVIVRVNLTFAIRDWSVMAFWNLCLRIHLPVWQYQCDINLTALPWDVEPFFFFFWSDWLTASLEGSKAGTEHFSDDDENSLARALALTSVGFCSLLQATPAELHACFFVEYTS